MLGRTGGIGLHWAYCLPHVCTTDDFQSIFTFSSFNEMHCHTKAEPRDFDASDITAM